jgi:hypothetical protein
MKRFSLSTLSILISFIGLTPEGASAAIDGLFKVESTNPAVLAVTPTESSGVFKVEFVGPGRAALAVSADVDLSDGDPKVFSQQFEFEIFDPSQQADHFDLQILGVEHADAAGSAMLTDPADHTADDEGSTASETDTDAA